jgi:hypothetical protein
MESAGNADGAQFQQSGRICAATSSEIYSTEVGQCPPTASLGSLVQDFGTSCWPGSIKTYLLSTLQFKVVSSPYSQVTWKLIGP